MWSETANRSFSRGGGVFATREHWAVENGGKRNVHGSTQFSCVGRTDVVVNFQPWGSAIQLS